MGRAQKQARRGKSAASVERKPTALSDGRGAGVTKRDGRERPDPYNLVPADSTADLTARVVKSED